MDQGCNMKINYRILKIDKSQNSIEVRYWTDKISEEQLSSEFEPDGSPRKYDNGEIMRCKTDYNINLYEIYSPSERDLEEIIMRNAPIMWLKNQEDLLDPSLKLDLSVVEKNVGVNKKIIID